MSLNTSGRRLAGCAALGWAMIAGCGSPTPSADLSPSSDQDPARYQKAQRDAEAKISKDKEAERAAFSKMKTPLPD